ncbi:segregation/condensation protein A [Mycoplasmopsis iners]|uniref:segregation/condensation protein A n=1 Tax=Mycoplasmopsis iners TaxID=76630 RepID=UPI000495E8D3|nr:segregation/condensation protein A [Mycoplasmopsis iners]
MNKTSIYENVDKKYDIKLENFDGPLDLLLALVQKKNIDIMEVDVLELAVEYLRIINDLKEIEIDIAGEYLVMASTLLLLKTRMTLHTPEEKPKIEEDKRELLKRLYEYQQFKEISKTLREQEGLRREIYIKKPSNVDDYIVDDPENDKSALEGHSNPIKLITILRKFFERSKANQLRKTKLNHFDLTPKDQIPFILKLFRENEKVTFEMIFSQPSIEHFVITLLAVLELARDQIIRIYQDEQFGEITFERGPEYEK